MMSRKDYIILAGCLSEWHREHGHQSLEEAYQSNEAVLASICTACARSNPRFSEDRFRAAVQGGYVPQRRFLLSEEEA